MLSAEQYKSLTQNAIVLATHNAGKIREIHSLLCDNKNFNFTNAKDLGLKEPDETGITFIENALLKAREAMLTTGLPALADDSGLCIDALNGEPGVYTADWFVTSEGHRDFAHFFNKIKTLLNGSNNLKASIHCVLALAIPSCEDIVIERILQGTLTLEPKGTEGFDFDFIFIPDGYQQTFAENIALKNILSARAQALTGLKEMLHSYQ
jgi:XTP/dITP diphosphohydrolase